MTQIWYYNFIILLFKLSCICLQLSENINIATTKKVKQTKQMTKTKKKDAALELEGNQQINQLKKKQFKKDKKMKMRKDKITMQLADGLENITMSSKGKDESYNFDTDFQM